MPTHLCHFYIIFLFSIDFYFFCPIIFIGTDFSYYLRTWCSFDRFFLIFSRFLKSNFQFRNLVFLVRFFSARSSFPQRKRSPLLFYFFGFFYRDEIKFPLHQRFISINERVRACFFFFHGFLPILFPSRFIEQQQQQQQWRLIRSVGRSFAFDWKPAARSNRNRTETEPVPAWAVTITKSYPEKLGKNPVKPTIVNIPFIGRTAPKPDP